MEDPDIKKNVQNAKRIITLVATSSSLSREGSCFGRTSLPAKVIFDKVQCSEIDFVKALLIIKRRFRNVYDRINIPRCWDGASHRFFPEAYPSEDKVYCKVTCDDLSANEFYDLPEDENRKWSLGDLVWIPINNPRTIECLQNGFVEINE